jgi:hypothetical protein
MLPIFPYFLVLLSFNATIFGDLKVEIERFSFSLRILDFLFNAIWAIVFFN